MFPGTTQWHVVTTSNIVMLIDCISRLMNNYSWSGPVPFGFKNHPQNGGRSWSPDILLSSNAFFSLVSRPELPQWLAPLFFSSRKALFLISLALCSLVSLSLCFQRFEYRQGPQCLRCAIFFVFLSMRNCIRLTVMYVTIGFSMVKYHNISALLHSQWLLQSCVIGRSNT